MYVPYIKCSSTASSSSSVTAAQPVLAFLLCSPVFTDRPLTAVRLAIRRSEREVGCLLSRTHIYAHPCCTTAVCPAALEYHGWYNILYSTHILCMIPSSILSSPRKPTSSSSPLLTHHSSRTYLPFPAVTFLLLAAAPCLASGSM